MTALRNLKVCESALSVQLGENKRQFDRKQQCSNFPTSCDLEVNLRLDDHKCDSQSKSHLCLFNVCEKCLDKSSLNDRCFPKQQIITYIEQSKVINTTSINTINGA